MFTFWHSKQGSVSSTKKNVASTTLESVTAANRQGLNKAGIIITNELEDAIQRCRKKVQRIARECRRNNRRFRDPEFDIQDDQDKCLHGLSKSTSGPTYYPSDVLRVNQIFEKPNFFINGATASDIAQGSIGDCWFLSGLSLIATAGLVEKICVERDEQVGVYGFIFWRDAGWVDVIVDDLLFVQIPKWREIDDNTRIMYKYDQDEYHKRARRGSKILYFSKSATENETWVPLIEKAYAKLHGDYASLDGGLSHEAIEDLSGAVSNWMYIRDTLDPERFWTEELLKANEDRLFACSIVDAYAVNDDGRRWRDPLNGLIAQHAYSVVKAMEYNGVKFVKVRNPWGMYEWQGRWSDGSKEWTGEWLDALKALDYSFGNDGEFLMEYSDFLNTWDSVERCRLFDDNWALSQLWLQVSLGQYPRPTNFGDVSFTISLSKPSSVVLMLSQLDTRYFLGVENSYKFSLSFLVFKSGEDDPIATSYHDALWRRSVNVEVDLEVGDYVVHVKVDREPPLTVPFDPAPLPVPGDPTPSVPVPVTVVPIGTTVDSRKKVQKKTELLISASVAANFHPSDYGVNMPLPESIYHGVDISSMELAMFESQSKFEADKKAAFTPKEEAKAKDTESEGKEEKTPDKPKDTPPETTVSNENGTTEKVEETKSEVATDTDTVKNESAPTDTSDSKDSILSDISDVPSSITISTSDSDSTSKDPTSTPDPSPVPKEDKSAESKPTPTPQPDQPITSIILPQPSSDTSKPLHEGYFCDGHKGQILGSRFHCLDISCPDYDLCETCMNLGVHNPSHHMLEIKKPDRELIDSISAVPTSDDVVTIGLKVYASKDCGVTIKGQLRHKNIIRNYVTMSRIM